MGNYIPIYGCEASPLTVIMPAFAKFAGLIYVAAAAGIFSELSLTNTLTLITLLL
jgi:hypothetical protein